MARSFINHESNDESRSLFKLNITDAPPMPILFASFRLPLL
jgi:hypothetical protein